MSFYVIPATAVAFGIYSYIKAKKNRLSQAFGFALMPGLWIGATLWCLLTGRFDIIFLVLVLIDLILIWFHFMAKK